MVLEEEESYVKPTQPAKEAQNASAVATVCAPLADPPGTRSLPVRRPAKPAGAIAEEPGAHVARAHAASSATRAAARRSERERERTRGARARGAAQLRDGDGDAEDDAAASAPAMAQRLIVSELGLCAGPVGPRPQCAGTQISRSRAPAMATRRAPLGVLVENAEKTGGLGKLVVRVPCR
jgi:hypothetical protein